MKLSPSLLASIVLVGCVAERVSVGDNSILIGSNAIELWKELGEPDIVSERYSSEEFFYLPNNLPNRQSGHEYVHYYLMYGIGVHVVNDKVNRVFTLSPDERGTIERAMLHYKESAQ